MPIGPSISYFKLMLTQSCIKGWKINPTKIQGPSTLVKHLDVQWCGACRDIRSKAKEKLSHLSLPSNKKESQHLVDLSGFWREHISHLSVLRQPIYQVN